jgi:hypothetical protein
VPKNYTLSDPIVRRPERYSSTDVLARSALIDSPVIVSLQEEPLISVSAEGDEVTLSLHTGFSEAAIEAISRVAVLLHLRPGWDSYDAPRIDRASIGKAIAFLMETLRENTPSPQVVPTPKGGVQIEWHIRGIDLEVEISPSTDAVFDFETSAGEEIEGVLPRDAALLTRLILRLSE